MPMKITSATFSACITSKDGLPTDELPIVALVGRSNVGKSSLINALTGRKELARTSSMPGKTLTINFYCINDLFYIVDLPGYGYAKASKVTRARIQAMMNEFFAECKNLKGVIQVLDVRHSPSPLDVHMHEWIKDQKINYFAVLTKSDKLSNQQLVKMRASIARDMKITFAMPFSAKTLVGREDFFDAVEKIIAGLELKPLEHKNKRPPLRGSGRNEDRQPGAKPSRAPRTGPEVSPQKSGNITSDPAKKNVPQRKDAPAKPDNEKKPAEKGDAAAHNARRKRWRNKKNSAEPRKDKSET